MRAILDAPCADTLMTIAHRVHYLVFSLSYLPFRINLISLVEQRPDPVGTGTPVGRRDTEEERGWKRRFATFWRSRTTSSRRLNLATKADRVAGKDPGKAREDRSKYLTDEKRIKAVTVCFTDLEGRFHMLDYDKKFLLKSADNLTFDGSSIRGFSRQAESDLRLAIDWPAFYWLPADVFGPGKVLVFGDVCDQDGTPYVADMRARLKAFAAELRKKDMVANVANEIEGFIFKGRDAERRYFETGQFEYPSTGGYYHSLPGDTLRQFIDTAAEVQRALGFSNEKDHPEVAPSQFEMNYGYSEATVGADQVQLYKLIARQVAAQMDLTACFLPKPVAGVNGSGCHTNMSIVEGGQEPVLRREGAGRPLRVRLERDQPDPRQRQRHLPDPELERERVPPARPALRGPEPDQGLGQRPRLDDPDPDRQRAHGPDRGALDRARRQPLPGDLRAVQDGARGTGRRGRQRRQAASARASCPTTSTTRSACSRRASSRRSCSAPRCTRSTPS